jgi:site-specific recombinase XerD
MPAPTFVDVAEQLIADAERRVRLGENSPSLIRDYRQRLNAYGRPFFKDARVDRIDRRRLREFQNHLSEMGLKTGTINPIMSFVSVVLKFAEEDGLIGEAPKAPRAKHRDCPRPAFSRAEYGRLLSGLKRIEKRRPPLVVRGHAVDWELRALVTFMTNTFLRPGDVFALRHRHIEVVRTEDDIAYLRLNPPSSKGHTSPVVSMPTAADIYQRVIKRRDLKPSPEDFVFMPDRQNRSMAKEVVRRQFTAVLTELGLKETAHGEERTLYSLRHTAITFRLLNAENLDLLTLARNCRTSVEMIDRFYASSLTAEMNRDRLQSFRRPTRYLS